MMMDLFSSMDGNTSLLLNFFIIFMTIIMIMLLQLSSKPSMLMVMLGQLKLNFKNKEKLNISLLIISSIFMLILFNNFMGMLPFVFSTTSSLWMNGSLSILLWGMIIISGLFFNLYKSLAHLAPTGSPLILLPLLVLIETVSIMIRPLTLTVRLVANITAGHIILTLISTVLSSSLNSMYFMMTIMIMFFYSLFEFFVCFIQAYIFTLLLSLYLQEHP
uniref:ATP synthase subunit a n=1 Tax=Partulina redfieldi TaxID=115954 RepID=A0A3S5HWS9_9EUPU|nr:ATP synthase F0 subunit 6 [Partulina redfieldi]AZZ06747.1 ATP synthase F0 subunit 6 [Partulina redfieldi]